MVTNSIVEQRNVVLVISFEIWVFEVFAQRFETVCAEQVQNEPVNTNELLSLPSTLRVFCFFAIVLRFNSLQTFALQIPSQ